MTKAGIYMLVNKVTGKTYIGSSRDCERRKMEHITRLRRGVHINSKLQASWNKHGEAAFEFIVVFTVLNVDSIEHIEQHFLDEADAVANGYNLAPTAGNTAGWIAPPETRKRMSEAAKKRDHSVQVAAMSKATRGRKRPQDEIDRIQATRRANAKPTTAETRSKMATSARARSRYSDADRAEMARLRDSGTGLREIARQFNTTSHAAIAIYIRDWKNGIRAQ